MSPLSPFSPGIPGGPAGPRRKGKRAAYGELPIVAKASVLLNLYCEKFTTINFAVLKTQYGKNCKAKSTQKTTIGTYVFLN